MLSELVDYDVLVIGELGDNDLLLGEHLSRRGLNCVVLRKLSKEKTGSQFRLSSYHTHLKMEKIQYYSNFLAFLRIAQKGKLIISFTGALIGALKYLWFLRRFLSLPPVINITTGSDITELSGSRSLLGLMYRQYLNYVDINWCANYPHAVKNMFKVKITKNVFMRYPYQLENGDMKQIHGIVRNREPILFFHPSHLDWKVNDPGRERNSSKGNDRFLRAFIKALKNGFPGCCILLDRGPDRAEAKELIKNSGVASRFIWKSSLSRDEIFQQYREADVIVDQFDVGGIGAICSEAMSVGKPVMVYLQENCMKLLYPESAPVLNCHTEEEIYEQIMKCRDKGFLIEMGEKARDWVYKYHSWENCLDQFLFYYTLLTGHHIVDYGWDRDPYPKG